MEPSQEENLGSENEFSYSSVKQNEYQMQMNRIFLAVLAGVVAGILRVEGVQAGLLMFMVWNLIGSAVMSVSIGVSSAASYFPNGIRDILLSQIFSGLLTYILVWTLVYDVVHIF